jgi:sugar-specific transcriptional regulator TrmB
MESTETVKVVQKNLQVLGIEPDTTRTYLALLKLGPTSALQVSKFTDISRTQIYRHLEQLQGHGLVSTEQLSYGTLFRALPLENIEGSIAAREAETAYVKNSLSDMAEGLRALTGANGPKSTTMHYYGLGGLKQVNWNLTKADKEYKVFEAAHLSQHFDKDGKAFARRCRERFIERQLTSYDLTNATSVTIAEMEPFEPSRAFIRHIDPEILKINFEMYLYNDTVTLIDYSPEELQATEIHHPALKAMMTQLFDSMWQIAEPLQIR